VVTTAAVMVVTAGAVQGDDHCHRAGGDH